MSEPQCAITQYLNYRHKNVHRSTTAYLRTIYKENHDYIVKFVKNVSFVAEKLFVAVKLQ